VTTLRTTLPLLIDSAVLAPVYRDPDGDVRLVLVVKGPGGRHGGQVAFPGGRREAHDADLLVTALREAEEEIGLSRHDVQVLSDLPVIETTTTGFRVAPFLARLLGPPPVWRRQETEIAEILEVPLSTLADPNNHGEELWDLPGWPAGRPVAYYRIGPHKLWGVTYRIVQPLLPRLLTSEWDV
jgi:8-oxo-dGTP pyrophosphatase MutT (NUDIX family)